MVIKYNHDRTILDVRNFDKDGILTWQRIETFDDQHRIIETISIKDGKREAHGTTKYEKYGYTVIDSNLFASVDNRVHRQTYRYDKLDKHNRPVVVSQLIDGKYLVVRKVKTSYYK